MVGRAASGQGQEAGRQRWRKDFLLVGDVRTYGGAYQGGPGDQAGTGKVVSFGTFNIRNGQKGGLESALFGMVQRRVDCGVLQETNLTNGVYMRESSGFLVMAAAAPSAHRGGIAIFYRKADHFVIKRALPPWAECHQIPDGDGAVAVACHGVLYPPPPPQRRLGYRVCRCGHHGSTLQGKYSCGRQYQCQPGASGITPREEAIADKLAAAGMMDMGLHFLPLCKPWLQDRCMWSM